MADKVKLKRGDMVKVVAGKDLGKEGKILVVDKKAGKVIVEGVNIITKHQKPNRAGSPGGLIQREAAFNISNVMYLHKGKPVRIGYKVEVTEKDGKKVVSKKRIAKPSGDVID